MAECRYSGCTDGQWREDDIYCQRHSTKTSSYFAGE